jgi:hypothetical protein
VFLDDGRCGGIQLHGYDEDAEAIADLLVHLRAIFRLAHDCMDENSGPAEEEIRAQEAGRDMRRTVGRVTLSVNRR